MSLYRTSLFCFLIFASISAQAQTEKIAPDLPTLSQQIVKHNCSPVQYVKARRKWSFPFSEESHPSWLRGKFVVHNLPTDAHWMLRLESYDGKSVYQTFTQADVTPTNEFWTNLFFIDTFMIVLESTDNIDGMSMCLESINVPMIALSVKSFIGGEDARVDLVKRFGLDSRYYSYGRAVVMVRFQDFTAGGAETNCTGVVVAPSLVATNNHCIFDKKQLVTALIIAGYETGTQSEMQVHVTTIEATNSALDYSILRVDRALPAVATISSHDASAGTKLIVIQHPDASLKMIAFWAGKKCLVQQSPAKNRSTDFYHLCDTSGGSSGSPIMDEHSGVVYGLHHLGVSDERRHDYHNLGVSFSSIMADLDAHDPQLAAEMRATH